MSRLTDPRALRPSIGREGWCQRLLTELVLDDTYPPYNSRRRPSSDGLSFLGALDELCFGLDGVTGRDVVFVDEIDFPARHPDEKGCAPDYTVFVDGRCWVIELKTEPGSHRPRQIPDYFERARHYHPGLRIDLTYLTAGLRRPFEPPTREWERFSHVEWLQVEGLIEATWSESEDPEIRSMAQLLIAGIRHLGEPAASWWERLGYAPVADVAPRRTAAAPADRGGPAPGVDDSVVQLEDALELASLTAADGRQRAIGLEAGGLEALQSLRLAVHEACREAAEVSPLRHVQPWLWSAATSGGKAMTVAGTTTGYELRLSRARPRSSTDDR